MDSSYSYEYFDREIRKRKKKIADLEERLDDEKEAFKKLVWQKAAWEWRLMHIIHESTKLNVEL